MNNRFYSFLFFLFLVSISGCSNNNHLDESMHNLKIFYDGKTETFQQVFGNLYTAKHPNVDLEFVSMNLVEHTGDWKYELVQLLEKEMPDVMVLNTQQYYYLTELGYLTSLNEYMIKSDLDTMNILPAILDSLRDGQGDIHGLAPTFYSTALYYNHDIFTAYGVPTPDMKGEITWDELLKLAQRFHTEKEEDRVFGLSLSFQHEPFDFARMIADLSGLSMYNPDTHELTLNTEHWRRIWGWTVEAYRSRSVYHPTFVNAEEQELLSSPNVIIHGKSAMSIGNHYLMDMIHLTAKDQEPINWNIANIPSSSNTSNGMYPTSIFVIPHTSSKPEVAWEMVRFFNSDDYAKPVSRSTNNLLSRHTYLQTKEGRSLEPFYQMKPGQNMYYYLHELPTGFLGSISDVVNRELWKTIEGRQELEQAINTISSETAILLNDRAMKHSNK